MEDVGVSRICMRKAHVLGRFACQVQNAQCVFRALLPALQPNALGLGKSCVMPHMALHMAQGSWCMQLPRLGP